MLFLKNRSSIFRLRSAPLIAVLIGVTTWSGAVEPAQACVLPTVTLAQTPPPPDDNDDDDDEFFCSIGMIVLLIGPLLIVGYLRKRNGAAPDARPTVLALSDTTPR